METLLEYTILWGSGQTAAPIVGHPLDTEDILQEICTEFETMLIYIEGIKTAMTDQVERGIFRRLLGMIKREETDVDQ